MGDGNDLDKDIPVEIVRSNWFLNIFGNNNRICLWIRCMGWEKKRRDVVSGVKDFWAKQMEEWKYHSERCGKLLDEQSEEEI